MALIDLAYDRLKNLELIRTKNDYSMSWLGMEDSYYRTLQSKKRHASAKVYGRLAKRLMDQAALHRIQGEQSKAIEMSCLASACINEIVYGNIKQQGVVTEKSDAHL